MTDTTIVRAETAIDAAPADSTTQLLQAALDKGVSVESLEKLVALHERILDRNAASEFAAAMAEFQAECPSIPKRSTTNVSKGGVLQYSYNYAELDVIAEIIGPCLHTRGLSYSWDSDVADGRLTCTCTVRHSNGHKQSAKFTCPIDDRAAMSEPQKYTAALTYARRQALIQALGLTTTDPDNDGADPPVDERIGPGQCEAIEDLLLTTKANREKFLNWLQVDEVERIRLDQFDQAIQMLKAKKGFQQESQT